MTLAMNQKVSLGEAARLFDEMEEGPKSQWQKTQDLCARDGAALRISRWTIG